MSAAEARAFEDWLAADVRHEQAYDRAITVWSAVEHLRPEDIDADLMGPLESEYGGLAMRRWFGSSSGLTAAALALMIVAPLFFWLADIPREPESGALQSAAREFRYATDIGQVSRVTLADGTAAALGPATQLTFVASDGERRAFLGAGEVFLEVVSDPARPFTVRADKLVATVTGTALAVRLAGGVSRVAVSEGEVSVSYPLIIASREVGQREQRTLTSGLQVAADIEQGLSPTQSIPIASIGAWREQRLLYHGAALPELLADIKRYAGIDTVVDPTLDWRTFGTVSASFSSRDIKTMTETLPDLFPVTIRHDGQGRLIVDPAPAPNS